MPRCIDLLRDYLFCMPYLTLTMGKATHDENVDSTLFMMTN